jgi:hypothetical protein
MSYNTTTTYRHKISTTIGPTIDAYLVWAGGGGKKDDGK